MIHARLFRELNDQAGTFGRLITPELSLVTLEPPWRNNERNVSCIPEGLYECVWHCSPRFGWVYLVKDVRGRSNILLHAGNLARHTLGCLLVGARRGRLEISGEYQSAILASRVSLRRLFSSLGHQPFTLEITS